MFHVEPFISNVIISAVIVSGEFRLRAVTTKNFSGSIWFQPRMVIKSTRHLRVVHFRFILRTWAFHIDGSSISHYHTAQEERTVCTCRCANIEEISWLAAKPTLLPNSRLVFASLGILSHHGESTFLAVQRKRCIEHDSEF